MSPEPDRGSPQHAIERRIAARHLLGRPLFCAERDPDVFRLIRRHEADLDRWFTQRLGYRLHVGTDTARLYKSGYAPARRPLRIDSRERRPLRRVEYTMLALILASTAAGPSVISLRDLVGDVRSAAAEAGIDLTGDATERRAVVAALRWMIDQGLVSEMHEHVDRYATDEGADAVLRIRPDRIAFVPLPSFGDSRMAADSPPGAAETAPRVSRQFLRSRLVEDPVVTRTDCSDDEWAELRRRVGEETLILEEMFGFAVEARSEGIAAIDPDGRLSDERFPVGGTIGHASLLLIGRLAADANATDEGWFPLEVISAILGDLATAHAARWKDEYVESPHKLASTVLRLLVDLRLAEGDASGGSFRLLPPAHRFALDAGTTPSEQAALF